MLTIYHNPRCSKSRQTLALLEEQGQDVVIIEYLKAAPSPAELRKVIAALGISPRELLRSKEAEFKIAGLDNQELSNAEIIAKMVEFPKLIERPIVINGNKAAIGRPPESVLEIL
jgi:arsenate reductase